MSEVIIQRSGIPGPGSEAFAEVLAEITEAKEETLTAKQIALQAAEDAEDAVRDGVAVLEERLNETPATAPSGSTAFGGVVKNGTSGAISNNWKMATCGYKVGAGLDIEPGSVISAIGVSLQVASSGVADAYIQVRIRDTDSPDANEAPTDANGAEVIGESVIEAADFAAHGLIPGASASTMVLFQLPSQIVAQDGTTLFVTRTSREADGDPLVTGYGRNETDGASQDQKGYISTDGVTWIAASSRRFDVLFAKPKYLPVDKGMETLSTWFAPELVSTFGLYSADGTNVNSGSTYRHTLYTLSNEESGFRFAGSLPPGSQPTQVAIFFGASGNVLGRALPGSTDGITYPLTAVPVPTGTTSIGLTNWSSGGTADPIIQTLAVVSDLADTVQELSLRSGDLIRDETIIPNWDGVIRVASPGGVQIAVGSDTGEMIMLQNISQSNGVPSGEDNAAGNIFTSADFPHQVYKFTAGRNKSGDPLTGGGPVNPASLTTITPSFDDAGSPSYPMTCAAFLAQYHARWNGLPSTPYLTRSDAQGSIPVTWLAKGADTGPSPKYFYYNACQSRIAGVGIIRDLGLRPVYVIWFCQGEDTSVATDEYQTVLSEGIIDAHFEDSAADVGITPVAFVIEQSNGVSNGEYTAVQGAGAQIAEAEARFGTNVVCMGPMYQYPLAAELSVRDIHTDSAYRTIRGELFNRVVRKVRTEGTFEPLNVARLAEPALGVNQRLRGANLMADTKITALGTGTGGIGTYTLNNTFSSPVSSQVFVAFGAVFIGSITGSTLTVTKVLRGKCDVSIDGSEVTVNFNRPVLMVDDFDEDGNGTVPGVGPNLGFQWDDANNRDIDHVEVSGRTCVLHLTGAPATPHSLKYAWDACDSDYYHYDGDTGDNWAATRGVIYSDTGEASTTYRLTGVGTPTIRDYLVRFNLEF